MCVVAVKKNSPAGSQASAGGYLRYGVTSILNEWHSSLNPGIPLPLMAPFSSPLGTITLRLCKIPTPQAHLCKKLLQTTTHFQINMPTMKYDFARRLIEFPAQRLYLMTMPRHIQSAQYKQSPHIICQSANAKEYRIGPKLPTRHPLHPKTDLQFLDPVFAALSPLVVPFYNLFCRLTTVRRNHCIPFCSLFIIKQIALRRSPDHHQT